MRGAASCTLLVASVLLAASCAAARPGPAVNVNEWAHTMVETVKEWGSGHVTEELPAIDLVKQPELEKEVKYTLLVKYIVRPSLAKEFSEQQLKVRDEAKKAKGFKIYTLSKPLTDNVLFYTYEEWESKKDFFEYLTGNETEVKKLAKYVEEKDIPLTLSQLIPFASHAPHHGHHGPHGPHDRRPHRVFCNAKVDSSLRLMMDIVHGAADPVEGFKQVATVEDSAESLEKRDPRSPKDTIVLTKFVVKPSQAFRFVHVAERFAEASSEEKGNLAYGFSKPLTDDYSFYSYSVYESNDAAKHHLEAPHTRDFFRFVLDEDVLTTTTVLLPIETLA